MEDKKNVLDREFHLPADFVGAGLFLALALGLFFLLPRQVAVSERDVVNGRAFPSLLAGVMIICSGILLVQGILKRKRGESGNVVTLCLRTQLRAALIFLILVAFWGIGEGTGLFPIGAVFCGIAFLLFFRCKKGVYYVITVTAALLIWAGFRFGLGVRF